MEDRLRGALSLFADSIERVAADKGIDLRAGIASLVLDQPALEEREARRQALLDRMFYLMRKEAAEAAAAETGDGYSQVIAETLTSTDEMRTACAAFDTPMFANMSSGGLTPILSAAELKDIGYAIGMYPAMTSLVAAAAMRTALTTLKTEGLGETPDQTMVDFKEFCGLIGFEDVWAFEKKWAK